MFQTTREGKNHLNCGLPSPNRLHKCQHYLFILLLQFSSLFFIRLFIICSGVVPHLSQFLCDIPNGQTRVFSFDFWTKLRAKQEKSRTTVGGGVKKKKEKFILILDFTVTEVFWPLLLLLNSILKKRLKARQMSNDKLHRKVSELNKLLWKLKMSLSLQPHIWSHVWQNPHEDQIFYTKWREKS